MTDYVGGFRYRLIHESLYQMIESSLDALGWFDGAPGRQNVQMVPEQLPLDTEIPLNTISLADFDMLEEEWEVGSDMSEVRWTFYVDFYGANRSIAIHLINDVRDILRGKMSAAGRTSPSFAVYDWSLATPVEIFTCDIENVLVDKPETVSEQWLKNWYTCRFEVVDYYYGS